MAKRKRANPWTAVSILCTPASCEAARALKGVRYLSADAPRLPVPGCTQLESCPCVYRKYADRRSGPRRESESSGLRRQVARQERRRSRGRRQADH